MTINKLAYDTTACIGFRLDKTIEALKMAYHSGEGMKKLPPYNIYSLFGGSAISNAVPAFAHPLSIAIDDNEIIFIDVRSMGSIDINTNDFKVRNEQDYNLLLARAQLNSLWITNPLWLRNVSEAPIALFASWISESVSRRFGLDPREQFNLAIMAAVFYNSQFSNAFELDETNKLKIVNTISRAMRVQASDVIDIIDKSSIIGSVFDFCNKAEEVTGSIRLKDLNPGVLFTILGGTWFGANSKEIIAVAVEHPPTWISVLLASYTERTYRNSQISKLTERSSFKKSGENFVKATLNLLRVGVNN